MTDALESSREPTAQAARRAEVVSAVGLFLQLVVFGVMLLVALWNQSSATFVTSFFVLGGVIIWLATLLIYHQEKLVCLEALEAEQIDRDREAIGAEALFDEGRSGLDSLLVARSRLEWMRKWLIPSMGALTSIYLVAVGFALNAWYLTKSIGSDEWGPVSNASVSLAFVGGVAFISFLFSRYTVGMARIGPMWRLMRAGGSYLTGNALMCAITAGMLGFASYGKDFPEQVFAKIVPLVMWVIAAEFVLNLVLDVYRPRKPGEVPRPGFDSRLLGLISEPGGIARTIADAVNYQFGFEVSKTWFYQLLQRWALVLVGAAVVILFLMTCVVIVEPGEQAVVERFGYPLGLSDGSVRAMDPGLNFKLPWPIDRATRYKVDKIHSVVLGFGQWKRKNPPKVEGVPKLILWTNPIHGPGEELDFVMPVRPDVEQAVATSRPFVTTQRAAGETARTPAVNLLRIAMPVLYRINDLYRYAFNYANPETLIESSAYGELVKYVAGQDLDAMLAEERRAASEELQRRIQAKCDALKVGVEITFCGLENIHPPQKAAAEFETYLNAKYEKGAAIAKAMGQADKILTEAVGDLALAKELAEAINQAQRIGERGAGEAEIAEGAARIETLFAGEPGRRAGVSGEAAEIIAVARAIRWTTENATRGRSAEFLGKLSAYRSAPRLYKMREIVETLIQGLAEVDKYVIARDGEVYVRYDAIQRDRIDIADIDYNVPPG
ncbi:MAG: hypothetical protein JXQ73_22780 [Phycisphaerae bacterium]|nr:hypothetical protein [Phycisphaerae bacterium]